VTKCVELQEISFKPATFSLPTSGVSTVCVMNSACAHRGGGMFGNPWSITNNRTQGQFIIIANQRRESRCQSIVDNHKTPGYDNWGISDYTHTHTHTERDTRKCAHTHTHLPSCYRQIYKFKPRLCIYIQSDHYVEMKTLYQLGELVDMPSLTVPTVYYIGLWMDGF
jgi:hypothetical protein